MVAYYSSTSIFKTSSFFLHSSVLGVTDLSVPSAGQTLVVKGLSYGINETDNSSGITAKSVVFEYTRLTNLDLFSTMWHKKIRENRLFDSRKKVTAHRLFLSQETQ